MCRPQGVHHRILLLPTRFYKKDLHTMVSRHGFPACYTLKDDLEDDPDDSALDEVPKYYYDEV